MNFVDGQEQERMLVVNARTGEFVVDNFDRDGDIYKTGFNSEEYQKILDCPDNIVVNEEKLYLVADETSAPYEDWENPFTRTEEDDAFDLKVAEKFGLVLE